MKYTDVIRNPHFARLAAVIRLPYQSPEWRNVHRQDVPFWSLIDNVTDVMTDDHFASHEFVNRFCALITALTQADPRLSYTEEDLAWFVEQMDRDDALTIASMLMAYASAPDEPLTPAEAAQLTGLAESTWRNRAAAGRVPGAVKKGKQWLLPRSIVTEWNGCTN